MSVTQTIKFQSFQGQTLSVQAYRVSDNQALGSRVNATNLLDDNDDPTTEYTANFSLAAGSYVFRAFNPQDELIGEYPRTLTYETRTFDESTCCDIPIVPGDVVSTPSNLILPENAQRLGCAIPTKGHVFLSDEKVCATLQWTFRNRAGEIVDLSQYEIDSDLTGNISISAEAGLEEPEVDIYARFQIPEVPTTLVQIKAVSPYPARGQIYVEIPDQVASQPGIWQMQVALVDTVRERPIAVDSGLLSVERTLWGDPALGPLRGPLTLQEIRTYLRDTPQENELLQEYEFGPDEIIYAMLRPVRDWNELPPSINRFTTMNFPFPENWTKATVGCLLHTAGLWYLRNKANVTGGGLQFADRDKDAPYLALAEKYRAEWMEFLRHQKYAYNVRRAFQAFPGLRPGLPGLW